MVTWRKIPLIYGWLHEQARLIKSYAVIGYPRGQDGAILPSRDYPPCPARKISPKASIINPLLTKLVWSRRLDIGLGLIYFFFCCALASKMSFNVLVPITDYRNATRSYRKIWSVRMFLRKPNLEWNAGKLWKFLWHKSFSPESKTRRLIKSVSC